MSGGLFVMGSCVVSDWCCCYVLYGCMNGASPVRFVLSLLYMCAFDVILPRLTRRTFAQLRTNKLSFHKVYLHKVDAKTHPSTHTHHLFNCTHIRTTLSPLNLWTDPVGVSALLARWTTIGKIGLPPPSN